MTERQYAEHAGMTRGAVSKAKRSDRLVLYPDGSINAKASDKRLRAGTDPSKSRRPRADVEVKAVPEAAVAAVSETLREQGLDAPTVGKGATFLQAKTAHEVLKAQERRLKLQQLRGDLVDRERATALVFRLAREERDAWVNWPARVAPLVAAELGVDVHALQQLLEKNVRAHLAELAEIRPEFR